jgi:hypothetical protein
VTPRVEASRNARLTRRTVIVNIVVLVGVLAAVEVVTRVAVYAARGSATAGLEERTLNLEYEPFVMIGPGWDGQLAVPAADVVPNAIEGGAGRP